jgi:hypothetical protein
MMKNDPAGTIIAIALVAMLYYLFVKNQLKGAIGQSGVPVIASFAGAPTYGYAAGTNPLASVFTDSIFVPGETSSSQNQNPLGLDTGNLQSGILFTS